MEDKKTKEIIFGEDARQEIKRGVEIVRKAVATTFGSKGRNVGYELPWGPPNVIHDGVTVAKEVILKNPFQNFAAQLVIQAAIKTNEEAGDGTTTATVLVDAIVQEGLKNVSSGVNPTIIRKGIENAVAAAIEEIKRIAKPIKSREEMIQVATISAADKEMGELIATAIEKVGEKGVVSVQEGTGNTTEVEYKEGMEFDRGFISPYLITNPEKFEVEYKAAGKDGYLYVIILNEKMTNDLLVKFLEQIYHYSQQAKVLIIADDYEADAMGSIVLTKIRNRKPLVAVKSPDFGEHRTNLLTDIATVTGGMVIGGNTGMKVENVGIDSFGRCEKAIVTQTGTIIIGGRGKKEDIAARVIALQGMLAEAKMDEYKRDKVEGRLAKLVGGVAVINVGAPSEAEMREKKERIFDAVNATKAAVSEGIIPGGGVALLRARKAIDTLDWGIGADIVRRALAYPIKQIIANSGAENVDYIVGKIEQNKSTYFGYDVDSDQYVNLIERGIIDPIKVSITALRNAASIATMLITTECIMVNERENHKTNKTDDEGIGNWEN